MKKRLVISSLGILLFVVACAGAQDPTPDPPAPAATVTADPDLPASEPTAEPTVADSPIVSATESPTAPQDSQTLEDFVDLLQAAVSTQDYAAMRALMSDPMGAGPWRSQWQTLTPSQFVQQLEGGALPAPNAVQFSDLDLTGIEGLLDGQAPQNMLGPDVEVAAVLHSGGWGPAAADDALLFVTAEEGGYAWSAFLYTYGRFADANLEAIAAPVGTIYSVPEGGVFQAVAEGAREILDPDAAALPDIRLAPDGSRAAYISDNGELWLMDLSTGTQEQLAGGHELSPFLLWGDNETLFVGVWLDPSEADGPNIGHLATIDTAADGRPLTILDESRLSANLPDLADDGLTVVFDVLPAGPDDITTGRLFHPESGLVTFDPADFTAEGEVIEGWLFNPTWSPDGARMTWLVSSGDRIGLQVYDLEAQTVRQVFDWDPARFGGGFPAPRWSPDGAWLALHVLASGPEGTGVWLIAADGSSQIYLDPRGQSPQWVDSDQLLFTANDAPRIHDLGSQVTYRLDLPQGSRVLSISTSDAGADAGAYPVDETSFLFVLTMQDTPIYDGPADSYSQTGVIFDGQLAKVTGRSPETGWWRVICPDDTVGNCWVTDDTAFTLATESADPTTSMPDPADLPGTVSQFPSPDDRWQATTSLSDPVLVNDSERYYVSLSVTNGETLYLPVVEWRNYGLGFTWPAAVSWSDDGRYLFYTNMAQPDGCAVFMSGTDLYRLDTQDGAVEQIIPTGATASLSISPDQTAVAYTHWDGEKMTFVVTDIATGNEKSVAVTEPGQSAQAGNLLWSSDNSRLYADFVFNACLPESTYSLAEVDLTRMSVQMLVDQSEDGFAIVEWADADEQTIRLSDADGRFWLLDVGSGELTPEAS